MAKVPLGALNERSTGEIKTVLNEDIEKLELFLAHDMPELVFPVSDGNPSFAGAWEQLCTSAYRCDKTEEILNILTYEGGMGFPKKHGIELKNVTFSYNGNGSGKKIKGGPSHGNTINVLEHCNLKIKDGERMALVGRSGAGKSTVIELISRFYDLQEGQVIIGGRNVKDIQYETLLENVAIVFQKTFSTRDSVFENIRMGNSATLEQVRRAAKEAQIDDFIMSLPDGYRIGNVKIPMNCIGHMKAIVNNA